MSMKLCEMRLANFKGIPSFDFIPDGHDVDVYGDNSTGKTTLFDAFTWLLFGRDSLGRADFEIKTLDAEGKVIPGLDHSVTAALDIDGRHCTMVRTYREKYTKKRGTKDAELTGHETAYVIDDVPMKEMEYQAAVKELIPEAVFKLLTNARFFNEQLDWKNRRQTLITICGGVTDDAVIASDAKLAELKTMMPAGMNLDTYRAGLLSKRGDINKELEVLPARIDEATKAMPEAPGVDPELLVAKLEQYQQKKAELERERAQVEAGGAVAAKTLEMKQVESDLLEAQLAGQAASGTKSMAIRLQRDALMDKFTDITQQICGLNRLAESNTGAIQRLIPSLENLRLEWQQRNADEWVWNGKDTCPTCGQILPENKITAAREKAESEFNLAKSNDLEEMVARGKAHRATVDELTAENMKITTEIDQKEKALVDLKAQVDAKNREITELQAPAAPAGETEQVVLLRKKRDVLEGQISLLRTGNSMELERIGAEINKTALEIQRLTGFSATLQQRETIGRRIEELKKRGAQLAQQFDECEKGLYLVDLFIRTRVSMLEGNINSRFPTVRFKLFDIQLNGATTEICETTVGGVPYGSMNNAARLQAGIEIMNVLSKHYGVSVPCFLDGAEAVTSIPPFDGQMIRLYVSATDPVIRVETAVK